MHDPIEVTDPGPFEAARNAKARMESIGGTAKIVNTSASGTAVHFGDQALFVPGKDPQKLQKIVEIKILELACAYAAWEHVSENPHEGNDVL